MRTLMVTGPGQVGFVDEPEPVAGPKDILVSVKACGICGSDVYYTQIGGLPGREGRTPLGHEAAGEVVGVGDEVQGIAVGDHVVVNPLGDPSDIIGNGGSTGALTDLLVIRNAELGRSVAVVPKDLDYEVAALNEPMAVSYHAVNRTEPKPGDKVVIFGAGPVGLGAAIGYRRRGVAHVVVVDVIPSRLEKALAIGADAVIDSRNEDVAQRLIDLHGSATDGVGRPRAGTDIFLDAAGVPVVIQTAIDSAKYGATLGIVAVHKEPVPIDFGAILTTELRIVTSMGYPTEIFEVTSDIIANRERYALIISDRFAFDDAVDALGRAATPGAADKVVVRFD